MGSFTDNKGRSWPISLSVGVVKKVRNALEIDLLDLSDATFGRLAGDVVLMHDLIWLLCQPEASKRGIDEEEFGAAVVGDPLSEAIGLVLEAIPSFFHGPKKSLIEKAVQKMKAMRVKAEELTEKAMDDPEFDAKMTEAMVEGLKAETEAALTRLRSPSS